MKKETQMATLTIVPIDKIGPNPHRDLRTYPWIERKLDHLKHSIRDVGMWEGVIGRPGKDGRFELAFGHHRLEAAKSLGLKTVPLIVRDLSDADMLRFMGRENGEDYASDFLIMLNTWEGAVKFTRNRKDIDTKVSAKVQPIEIARFLGWTRITGDGEKTTPVASACYAAHALIEGGYLARSDLDGLTVSTAREIVERAQSQAQFLERQATENKTPVADYARVKSHFSTGIKTTIRQAKEGSVAQKNLRDRVDLNVFDSMKPKKGEPPSPLFTAFAEGLLRSIRIAFNGDAMSDYLSRIEEALPHVTLAKDLEIVVDIQHELGKVETRVAGWRKRLTPNKVTSIRPIEKKGA